ncbi:hypothetical protein C8J56DRAFT_1062180 [Mycena floridula]|nr:hypothetical protein C8J56DRAFT_1062180 [Mycena floridula]
MKKRATPIWDEDDWMGDDSLQQSDDWDNDPGLSTVDKWDEEDLASLIPSGDIDVAWLSPTKAQHRNVGERKRQKRSREISEEKEVEYLQLESSRNDEVQIHCNSQTDWASVGNGKDDSNEEQEDGQKSCEEEGDETFEERCEPYADAVLSHWVGFYQIGAGICIVGGWDPVRRQGTVCELCTIILKLGDQILFNCRCRGCRNGQPKCIHTWFCEEYHEERFPAREWDDITDSAHLATREPTDEGVWLSVFSVGLPDEASRAVVIHNGDNDGGGHWTCSKSCGRRGARCRHIVKARLKLARLVTGNPDAEDGAGEEWVVPDEDVESPKAGTSVSYMPIRPPEWASLPTDNVLYSYPAPLRHEERTIWDGTGVVEQRPCTVYTLVGAFETTIELVRCPKCDPRRRQYIGPDPRDQGLFNCNNRVLFSHDLLNDFTNAFTTSETPLFAWVTSIQRRYSTLAKPFPSYRTVSEAWFGFVGLQEFEQDMFCGACGVHPKTVICDGVSAAIGKKHVLETIEPPTSYHAGCDVRSAVKSFPKQQLILDAALQVNIRRAVKKIVAKEGVSAEVVAEAQVKQAVAARDAYGELAEQYGELASLFKDRFLSGETMKEEVRTVYRDFLLQLAADESILQMVPRPALHQLDEFNLDPRPENVGLLIGIPGFFNVLGLEMESKKRYKPGILKIGVWIAKRAQAILTEIMVHRGPPKEWPSTREETKWQISGSCYSMPQIRDRPEYPRLPWDRKRKAASEKRGLKCSKFFGKYGPQTRTGGLMIFWCTHSICYGFHFMPSAEGRDDVFSALITHWPTAPEQVIYDFACALGPYCMLREPDFFADTQFMIDAFHSKGHTKCSPAAFVQTYSKVDPRLATVNTSAAECGNGVIGRIRKSLSFMGQERAIKFTRVFVCIMNRMRIRAMGFLGRREKK